MEGVNGIQAARALRDKKEEALLIFITGFKEYVFEAFDVAAFHYLLKPVEEKNLRRYLPKRRTILLNRKDILGLENQGRIPRECDTLMSHSW